MSVFLSPSTIYKSSFGILASGTKMKKKTAICPVSHPEIFILAFFYTHLRNLQLLQIIENSSLHGGKNDDKKKHLRHMKANVECKLGRKWTMKRFDA